ncbi:MAG: hypothetical protein ACI9AT_000412, partial [Ulvibacter sp.]
SEKLMLEKMFGSEIFETKKYDQIKTIGDVLKDNGISQSEFDKSCVGLSKDEVGYRVIKLICKSLNQGWTPDWSDLSEYKYVPWFEINDSSGFRCDAYAYWFSVANFGSRLCFKTKELAEYAGKQFEEVYKDFMVAQ